MKENEKMPVGGGSGMPSQEPAPGGTGARAPGSTEHLDGAEGAAPSRKDRERAMHRGQILEAARNLLGRKPYNEIAVQEIAADSEFSVGYIYKIFESKEEVYVTLVKDMWDELLDLVGRRASEDVAFDERLEHLVYETFSWLDANPSFTANHMYEIHCLARALPRLAKTHAEMEDRLMERAAAFLADGVRAGVLEGDIEMMMKTLRALIWGFVGEDMLHGTKSRKWSEYTPVVVRVFLRAFAPEGGTK